MKFIHIIGCYYILYMFFLATEAFAIFHISLRVLKIKNHEEYIEINGQDPETMTSKIWVLWMFPSVGLLGIFGLWPLFLGLTICVILWVSLRIEIKIYKNKTLVTRNILWKFPWKKRIENEIPYACVEGWGDSLDPSTVTINFRNGSKQIALAMGDSTSGDLEDNFVKFFDESISAVKNRNEK